MFTKPKALESAKKLTHLPLDAFYTPAGIYFLCLRGEIVYIGKSTYVADRIIRHIRERVKEFDSVYYVKCEVECLDIVEGTLIKYFQPCYNRDLTGGDVLARQDMDVLLEYLDISAVAKKWKPLKESKRGPRLDYIDKLMMDPEKYKEAMRRFFIRLDEAHAAYELNKAQV